MKMIFMGKKKFNLKPTERKEKEAIDLLLDIKEHEQEVIYKAKRISLENGEIFWLEFKEV